MHLLQRVAHVGVGVGEGRLDPGTNERDSLFEIRVNGKWEQTEMGYIRWVLGCVNPAYWLPLDVHRKFTQPRVYLVYHPILKIELS